MQMMICDAANPLVTTAKYTYLLDGVRTQASGSPAGEQAETVRCQAREIVGAPTLTVIGRRLTNALAYSGRTENTGLLEEPEALGVELLQEEEEEAGAGAEAEKTRAGLTTFTDGSQLDDGAAVVRKNGQSRVRIETHMGHNREAYDAECAALARALESASRRQTLQRPSSLVPAPIPASFLCIAAASLVECLQPLPCMAIFVNWKEGVPPELQSRGYLVVEIYPYCLIGRWI